MVPTVGRGGAQKCPQAAGHPTHCPWARAPGARSASPAHHLVSLSRCLCPWPQGGGGWPRGPRSPQALLPPLWPEGCSPSTSKTSRARPELIPSLPSPRFSPCPWFQPPSPPAGPLRSLLTSPPRPPSTQQLGHLSPTIRPPALQLGWLLPCPVHTAGTWPPGCFWPPIPSALEHW